MSVILRPARQRGHARLSWLDSWHSFSFADYYDPRHMGFRALRVINEDIISPGTGFGTHGHRDMEIVTYVTSGSLEHRDSTGEHAMISQGEVQRMSAGTGIRHSEFNSSDHATVKLLQIWIMPEREGLPPGYEQKSFDDLAKRNRFCTIASADGRDGSVRIRQDVMLFAACLDPDVQLQRELTPGRAAWLQVVAGGLRVNGVMAEAGDGVALEAEALVDLRANSESEILCFDLGPYPL